MIKAMHRKKRLSGTLGKVISVHEDLSMCDIRLNTLERIKIEEEAQQNKGWIEEIDDKLKKGNRQIQRW